jgi:redox-sensitive bicupin YhaK (pirin superfamily)
MTIDRRQPLAATRDTVVGADPSADPTHAPLPRAVEARYAGAAHGFIRRLVSPSDVGERLKPFIFLDHLSGRVPRGMGFGFHPHSGIATLTYQLDADADYEDTTGQKGVLRATGLEWMQAGGGTWHQGHILPHGESITGFQLWVALPPGLEDGPPVGLYIPPEQVPQVGNVRVLLGAYEGSTNPIPAPSSMAYLDVVLAAGERWAHTPPVHHDVAWAYVYRGEALVNGQLAAGELLVLAATPGSLVIEAPEGARVLVGTAERHPHRLVVGPSSVHTRQASLDQGLRRIREIGAELKRDGRI